MPKIIILPEAHPEVLLQLVSRLATISKRAYRNADITNHEKGSHTEVLSYLNLIHDKYSLAEKKLFDLATDIASDEFAVLCRPDVSKVYIESRENDITLQLYGEFLKGKDIIWLYDDIPGIDLLTDRARRGVKDEFYYALQEDAEKHTVNKIVENPPEQGTVGILKYGRRHTKKGDRREIGNIPEMLREKGFDVEIMPSKDHGEKIDDYLRELGIDVDEIRISAMI